MRGGIQYGEALGERAVDKVSSQPVGQLVTNKINAAVGVHADHIGKKSKAKVEA